MGKITKKFSKNCISDNSRILDALNIFEDSGINLALVINKKNKFIGVITSSDVRRGLIKGLNQNSKIKKIINYSPLFLKDEIDEKTQKTK